MPAVIVRHRLLWQSPFPLFLRIVGIGLLTLFPLASDLAIQMPFITIGWPELTIVVLGIAIFCSALNLTGNICLARLIKLQIAAGLRNRF